MNNALEFYGLTVSKQALRQLFKNEQLHYDGIPKALIEAQENGDSKVDLDELKQKSHVYLGENQFPEIFVKNRK